MEKGFTFLELKAIEAALIAYIDSEHNMAEFYNAEDRNDNYSMDQAILHRANEGNARSALAKTRGAVMQ